MSDRPRLAPPDAADEALPLHIVPRDGLADWLATRPEAERAWLSAQGFDGSLGQTVLLPGPDGSVTGAAVGFGDAAARARTRFGLARAAGALPAVAWQLVGELTSDQAHEAALGWLLSAYRFDRYRDRPARPRARLVPPPGTDAVRIEALATAEFLTRDLINTPANDLGPAELAQAARALAAEHGATIEVTEGDALLDANLPLIHTVGRAAARPPCLIDLRAGDSGPRLTLVGKGICFDTGGLNLKPGASMGLMKKDMGGGATVLGLAQAILQTDWPVRLRVLIPAAENAVAGAAFRPGDILRARNGATVEINNTDAEGRLVLADALALADEEAPDALVCMATLTGAARVAVGPDLAPFYTDANDLADALAATAPAACDPVWRMPFHTPYEAMIEPGIADLDNAPSGGQAGSITAALFLRRFVKDAARFAHFDIYGWQPRAAPARPKGGAGQGARALFSALPGVLGLKQT